MSVNCEWEIQILKSKVEDIETAIEKKHTTLYGNGQEGLTTRISKVEERMQDFKTVKEKVEELSRRVYVIGVLLMIVMGALKLVPPDILQHIFK